MSNGNDAQNAGSFSFETQTTDEETVIVVVGELDAATAPGFKDDVENLLPQVHSKLRIDLASVQFIDSSGLRALLAIREFGSGIKVPVTVSPTSENAQKLLEITGLQDYFS